MDRSQALLNALVEVGIKTLLIKLNANDVSA